MKRGQNTSSAVMAQRVEPHDSLDYFPTHPWAVRALCEFLERDGFRMMRSVWEPACGEGYMARPLAEYFDAVFASDVFDYSATFPGQDERVDFLPPGMIPERFASDRPDWIVTNPPFRLAVPFVLHALDIARDGVAMFVRSQFLESAVRLRDLFSVHQPRWILQFAERVPLIKGRLDPKASSATAYCWVAWTNPTIANDPPRSDFVWIPPCRDRLIRPDDYAPLPGHDGDRGGAE